MFETASGEVRWRAAAVPGAAVVPADPGAVAYELNGAWAEHDWTDVPVWSRADEPPPGWDPETGSSEDRSWLDAVAEPHLGPVEWLRDVPPSALLMSDLEHLSSDAVVTDSDAVEMLAHWHRLEAHCAMQKRLAAAELARRTTMEQGLAALTGLGARTVDRNIASDEIAMRLGTGRRAAATLVRSGQAFTQVGIPTCEALAAGEIDAGKADLIIAGVQNLEPAAAIRVQDQVIAKAAHMPSGRVRRELAEAVAKVDPEHYEERCQAAMQTRRVDRPRVLPDGMASLYAVMPGVEATQLYRALDAAARSAKATGDTRTLDQLRADALGLMGATAVQIGWIGTCPAPPGMAVDDDGCECLQEQLHVSQLPPWARTKDSDTADDACGTLEPGSASEARSADATRGTGENSGTGEALGSHLAGNGTAGQAPASTSLPPPPVPTEAMPDPPHRSGPGDGASMGSPQGGRGHAGGSEHERPPGMPERERAVPGGTPLADVVPPSGSHLASEAPPGELRLPDGAPSPETDLPDAAPSNETHVVGGAPTETPRSGGARSGGARSGGAAGSGGRCGMRVGVIGGRSAHVRVVVPLTTIMGGEGGPGADLKGSDEPARLEGYGPIPASVARALAAGGPWARMVTDPIDRTVLEVSRDTYKPPAAMAELVRAREPECVDPTCGVSSDGCDLHHRVPWPVGATEVANLDPGCRRLHLLITHGGWVYWADERRGARTWRTAAGLIYREDAEGNLVLQRPHEKTPEQEAAAEKLRRLYAGPPPF